MEVREYVSLAPYTTLQVGGPARYLVEVTTEGDIQAARQFASQAGVPVLVLGAGSNILMRDRGFEGLVLVNRITGRTYTESEDGTMFAVYGAGESLDAVIAETVERGLWGLENLSHIPGTVGATPVQNVGAYGVEVSSLIVELTASHLVTGEQKIFTKQQCQFGYRDSYFKTEEGRDWVIERVVFKLSSTPSPVLSYKDLLPLAEREVTQSTIRDKVISIRSAKFPDWHTVGTAGSFFKNPIVPADQAEALKSQWPQLPTYPAANDLTKISLGYVLDKICGLKGYTDEKVGLYEHQALVLINTGDSAEAVEQFVESIKQIVKEKTGITIEQEVRTV